jgi:hypothetical protein
VRIATVYAIINGYKTLKLKSKMQGKDWHKEVKTWRDEESQKPGKPFTPYEKRKEFYEKRVKMKLNDLYSNVITNDLGGKYKSLSQLASIDGLYEQQIPAWNKGGRLSEILPKYFETVVGLSTADAEKEMYLSLAYLTSSEGMTNVDGIEKNGKIIVEKGLLTVIDADGTVRVNKAPLRPSEEYTEIEPNEEDPDPEIDEEEIEKSQEITENFSRDTFGIAATDLGEYYNMHITTYPESYTAYEYEWNVMHSYLPYINNAFNTVGDEKMNGLNVLLTTKPEENGKIKTDIEEHGDRFLVLNPVKSAEIMANTLINNIKTFFEPARSDDTATHSDSPESRSSDKRKDSAKKKAEKKSETIEVSREGIQQELDRIRDVYGLMDLRLNTERPRIWYEVWKDETVKVEYDWKEVKENLEKIEKSIEIIGAEKLKGARIILAEEDYLTPDDKGKVDVEYGDSGFTIPYVSIDYDEKEVDIVNTISPVLPIFAEEQRARDDINKTIKSMSENGFDIKPIELRDYHDLDKLSQSLDSLQNEAAKQPNVFKNIPISLKTQPAGRGWKRSNQSKNEFVGIVKNSKNKPTYGLEIASNKMLTIENYIDLADMIQADMHERILYDIVETVEGTSAESISSEDSSYFSGDMKINALGGHYKPVFKKYRSKLKGLHIHWIPPGEDESMLAVKDGDKTYKTFSVDFSKSSAELDETFAKAIEWAKTIE